MLGKERQEEREKDQEEQIIAFTKDFISYLFEIGSKENLPENLKFKGVNCVRNFSFGDSISFNIVFNKSK